MVGSCSSRWDGDTSGRILMVRLDFDRDSQILIIAQRDCCDRRLSIIGIYPDCLATPSAITLPGQGFYRCSLILRLPLLT